MEIWVVFRIENPSETWNLEGFLCFTSTGFKKISPAALLEPLRYSILMKSPPQAEFFFGLRPMFELKPPLVFPGSGTRGGG